MVCEATLWVGSGLLQVIEELRKPGWIVQKQPANHCLKPRGPSIHSGLGSSRTTACTIATPTDQIEFLGVQELMVFQPSQQTGLGISPNIGHNSTMQMVGTAWSSSMAETLMKLPDSISDPSQLQWSQLIVQTTG
jgi:hypothetical protein